MVRGEMDAGDLGVADDLHLEGDGAVAARQARDLVDLRGAADLPAVGIEVADHPVALRDLVDVEEDGAGLIADGIRNGWLRQRICLIGSVLAVELVDVAGIVEKEPPGADLEEKAARRQDVRITRASRRSGR